MGKNYDTPTHDSRIFGERIQYEIDNMTPESARALLDRTGFYDSDGRLKEELRDST